MSVQEKIKEDNLTQEAKDRREMEKLYSKLELLIKQIEFAKNKDFQEWMLVNVSKPLQDSIITHLHETDTNKSFIGKGVIRTYQKTIGWAIELAKEIAELKDEIYKREAALKDEDVPNNHRPEN